MTLLGGPRACGISLPSCATTEAAPGAGGPVAVKPETCVIVPLLESTARRRPPRKGSMATRLGCSGRSHCHIIRLLLPGRICQRRSAPEA
eukprot:6181160-Pleurochrysis_carterae.AAC.4